MLVASTAQKCRPIAGAPHMAALGLEGTTSLTRHCPAIQTYKDGQDLSPVTSDRLSRGVDLLRLFRFGRSRKSLGRQTLLDRLESLLQGSDSSVHFIPIIAKLIKTNTRSIFGRRGLARAILEPGRNDGTQDGSKETCDPSPDGLGCHPRVCSIFCTWHLVSSHCTQYTDRNLGMLRYGGGKGRKENGKREEILFCEWHRVLSI